MRAHAVPVCSGSASSGGAAVGIRSNDVPPGPVGMRAGERAFQEWMKPGEGEGDGGRGMRMAEKWVVFVWRW